MKKNKKKKTQLLMIPSPSTNNEINMSDPRPDNEIIVSFSF